MKLSALLDVKSSMENVENIANVENLEISGIAYNSRLVKKGYVFVAIQGLVTDGHLYVKSAEENGASCIICQHKTDNITIPQIVVANTRITLAKIADNYYNNPTKNMKIIGITGTNGKTTVTYIVKNILEHSGEKVGLIGTNQNMIGEQVIASERTTPESLELAELFANMRDAGCSYVVMEVSSHSIALERVAAVYFEVGAFTNLTQDHLDFHKSMEDYMLTKAKLFTKCKYSIINIDDNYGESFKELSQGEVTTYGIDNGDIKANNIALHQEGVSFSVGDNIYTMPIPGKFSVYNALCAIGICEKLNVAEEDIKIALSTTNGVCGRVEVVYTPNCNYSVIIDYAHTPDGLDNLLNAVKTFAKGRIVTLFGCGGDRDKTKRPRMGKIAGELSDLCIITSDNPRTEEPSKIILDILDGIKDTFAEYVVIENRRDAIEYALKQAVENDTILLVGKGHEDYQILGKEKIHFDEREIVADILSESNRR